MSNVLLVDGIGEFAIFGQNVRYSDGIGQRLGQSHAAFPRSLVIFVYVHFGYDVRLKLKDFFPIGALTDKMWLFAYLRINGIFVDNIFDCGAWDSYQIFRMLPEVIA